jgi:long-chain acyl-CoA synthetase
MQSPSRQPLGFIVNSRNLVELHRVQCQRLGPRTALRFKRHGLYHDFSWEQYRADALACAASLVEVGIQPGERVGLLSENRLEWLIADMGLLTAAAVNVPPHAPLSARQVHFQLDDATVRWLFVSTREQLAKALEIRTELPQLLGIVVFDEIPQTTGVMSWKGFLQRGRRILANCAAELERREAALRPDDLATIMYTSGTTGNPKGVMLTHHNLLSNAEGALQVKPYAPDDMVLNWLPLSHIYGRLCDHYQTLAGGATVALAESADTVITNVAEIQPTHMASVPRLYEKVLTAVQSPDAAKMRQRLRDVFGPRITWLSSGGAPLPRPIAEVYYAAGLPVYQGYGLTESSPIITFNAPGRNKVGTVGLPLCNVEVAIAPDGEILTRGPHVMKGYWKNSQATAESIEDGWLHTGDLGQIDADGYLSITGRKKELLVLSNGKKVVPSFLEGLLIGDDCIDQTAICGEGRNFLTALIVPHWENVRKALDSRGTMVKSSSPEAMAENPDVQALLRERIDAALAEVATWEQVRKFVVLPVPFTVAGEELTVSMKLRRNVVLQKYKGRLEGLYCE